MELVDSIGTPPSRCRPSPEKGRKNEGRASVYGDEPLMTDDTAVI